VLLAEVDGTDAVVISGREPGAGAPAADPEADGGAR
jgi:hypothetical protein